MFFDEHFDRRKRVMIHLAPQSAGRPVHDHMFVHFVVATVRRLNRSVSRIDLTSGETGADSNSDNRRAGAIAP